MRRPAHHANVPLSSAMAGPYHVPSAEEKARLARMVERDYRFTWRLLRRLGVPLHNVDDAAQQVFLIVAERLTDIRVESERSFAYGTALRVAQSFRRQGARERTQVEHEGLFASAPDPETLASQRRACRELDGVLAAMPLELRTVFVLFELEGMTSPEIASLAELPLGTVASRLRRAREHFRALCAAAPLLRRPEGEEP